MNRFHASNLIDTPPVFCLAVALAGDELNPLLTFFSFSAKVLRTLIQFRVR